MLIIAPCASCKEWDNRERMEIIDDELYCIECFLHFQELKSIVEQERQQEILEALEGEK
ncbi:hypothetical protein [Pueribacillus sp. YX66]|uniref:hypothetical protein n=1 Tax=Pueribacillus sp. YX66 TaxID=3229242 RepID=UPI00358D84AB